jgi:ATP-dependent Lhr-like helicase
VVSVYSTLHESLQQVLSQRLDWSELRDVQERSCIAISAGNDTLVIAPTAGGKSEAALIPVMDDILKHGRPGVACLYIAPLKALINDQEDRFSALCLPASLSVMKWHGDVPKGGRSWKGEPPHFLMITPESLEVLLQERELLSDLQHVRFIIIDELHAFVENDRGVHLKVLLDRMDQLTGRKIQRIGLSATTGNPREILSWLSDGRQGQELVAIASAPKEKHFRFIVEPDETRRMSALVQVVTGRKALVFVNSRSVAEHLVQGLSGRVQNLHIHHSSLSPEMRRKAEDAFLSDDGACIICTSTLELGIDIGDLDVVVQVNPPDSVSSFLQRMGRSGRRGRPAFVVWVLEDPCQLLCSCAIIECAIDRRVEDLHPVKMPYNVLLQQLFLTLHNQQRAGRAKVVSGLLSRPAFTAIGQANLEPLLRYLIQEGFIATDGEMLMPGTEAERVLGRSNWKDLYSVIAGGGEYRAMTPEGEVVGKLDARFVNSRSEGDVTLGGQTWSMVKCDDGHNIVVVVPSGAGAARTFWTGGSDGGLSGLICEQVGAIRKRGETRLPLAEPELAILTETLKNIPECIDGEGLFVVEEKRGGRKTVTVYSFHGSTFNRVLAPLLSQSLGKRARVSSDDFLLRITGAGKEDAVARVTAALGAVRSMTSDEIIDILPLPRWNGWKFAGLLPEDLFRKTILADYYHIPEFRQRLVKMAIVPLASSAASPGAKNNPV